MVDSRKRIASAFLIGGTMVAFAFFVASERKKSELLPTAGELTVAAPRTHIAITDSNANDIPDWQEALQVNSPLVLSEATTTYQAPTTVTGKFALSFFEDYIRSQNYGAFGDTEEELIAETTQSLVKQAIDELFTKEDLVVITRSDPEALKAYGNYVASIPLSQKSGAESEIIILQDAVRYNDMKKLEALDPIALSYVNMVKLMLETPVPQKYVKEHLDLLNAYNAVREDVKGMQKLQEDPMYTFLRLKRYQDDVAGLTNAVINLYKAVHTNC